jgi:hypothetical protein
MKNVGDYRRDGRKTQREKALETFYLLAMRFG